MEKYYDQSCPDCDNCGWFGQGNYPDGRPYIKCGWFGYILHEKVDAKCPGFMSHVRVEEFMNRYNGKLKGKRK